MEAMEQAQKIDYKNVDLQNMNPVLKRLIEEVRNEDEFKMVGNRYDRTHNRHNR